MKTLLHLLLYSLWISFAFGEVVYRWRYLQFDWDSVEQKNKSIEEGTWIKNASAPIGFLNVQGRHYISVPRDKGVPAAIFTLVKNDKEADSPLLRPYPDWSWTGSDCKKSIISVYRIDYDKCGRLWILDNGKTGDTQTCPPKILAFEEKTRKLLFMKEVPKEIAFNKKTGKGLLVTPMVQTSGRNCEKFTMYIADIEGYALIVWDGKNKFKRFDSNVFTATKPDFTLNNVSFHLEDGLVGMAIRKEFLHREVLYFSSLASTQMFHVPTKDVTIYSNKTPNYVEDKGNIDFRKVSLVIKGYTMYFCSLEDNALMSWDTRTQFTKKNVKTIWKSTKILQFVSDLRLEEPNILYGISNKYQKSAAGIRDINEYNYHVFRRKIEFTNY